MRKTSLHIYMELQEGVHKHGTLVRTVKLFACNELQVIYINLNFTICHTLSSDIWWISLEMYTQKINTIILTVL